MSVCRCGFPSFLPGSRLSHIHRAPLLLLFSLVPFISAPCHRHSWATWLSRPLDCLLFHQSRAAGFPPPPAQELGFPSEQRSRLLLVVPDGSQEHAAMLTFYRMGLPKHLCVPHVELIATFPVTPLRGCLARAQETAGMGITSWGSPDVPHLETALDSLIVPGLM